jgi:hypothetical protein
VVLLSRADGSPAVVPDQPGRTAHLWWCPHPVRGQWGVQEGVGDVVGDADLVGDGLTVGDGVDALVVVLTGVFGTARVPAEASTLIVDGVAGCGSTDAPGDGGAGEDEAAGLVTQVESSAECRCASQLPTTVTTISRAAVATAAGSATARFEARRRSGSLSPGVASPPRYRIAVWSSAVDM